MMLETLTEVPVTRQEVIRSRFRRKQHLDRMSSRPELNRPLLDRSTSHQFDFLGDKKDDTLFVMENFPGIRHYNVCIFLTSTLDTLITVVDSSAGGENVFARVRKELQVSYSRLRSQNGLFLMYTILDVLVDGLSPVIDALERHMVALRIEVRENANRREIIFNAQSDSDFLAKYHDVVHELGKARRRISPAIRVLHHLTNTESTIDEECKIYLRDVLDHAEEFQERLESMVEECRALKAEQQHAIDARLTKSMAALSVVSMIFLPGQFLSR